MRIAIIGAGAIGSALGALLTQNGQEVVLIGRAASVDAIRQNGLQVDGCRGAFTVHVEAAERLDFRPDLVLLTVKTQDVTTAVRDNLIYLTDVPLVTLQNGVRSDQFVAALLPPSQILSAVVRLAATYLTPGRVTLLERGALVVGRPRGPRDAQVEKVASVLNKAVPTRISDNIQGAHWLKLIVNLNNALPALTNNPMSQVFTDPYLRCLSVGLMREGFRVIDRAGIRLESLPGIPATLFRLLAWLPEGLAARLIGGMAHRVDAYGPVLGSTLQSMRRGRPTEIDYLNGEVVQLGRQVGVPTALNAHVVELVHRVEQTGQFLSADAIRHEMKGMEGFR